jgi:uncharacterized protein (DUF2147 family)
MSALILFIHLLFISPTPTPTPKASYIVGQWISKNKDLKIEVFERNGLYFGKMVWFSVYDKNKSMNDFKDTSNPNKSLKGRNWKDMIVLQNLKYNADGYWSDGDVYDPNSGRTYSSLIKVTGSESIIVRGYVGFEILGKSIEFTKFK